MTMPVSFLFLSSVCCDVSHASLVIAFNPTRHFSYSSGSRSSMYFLMLSFACSLRYDISLLQWICLPAELLLFLIDCFHLCLVTPLPWLYAIQRFVASLCSFVAILHAWISDALHIRAYYIQQLTTPLLLQYVKVSCMYLLFIKYEQINRQPSHCVDLCQIW